MNLGLSLSLTGGSGGAGGVSFNPESDSSIVSWWDMSDEATITEGAAGVVSTVSDKSGNGFGLGPSSGTFLTGGATQNGLNVVTHDGSANTLPASSYTFPASGNAAIHGVMSIDTVDNALDSLLGWNGTGSTQEWRFQANNASQFNGQLFAVFPGTWDFTLTGGPYSGWVNFSMIWDFDGTSVEIYIGDTLRGSDSSNYASKLTTGVMYLLNNNAPNNRLAGKIAEIIVTEDLTNRSDYYTYLSDKWNVA